MCGFVYAYLCVRLGLCHAITKFWNVSVENMFSKGETYVQVVVNIRNCIKIFYFNVFFYDNVYIFFLDFKMGL